MKPADMIERRQHARPGRPRLTRLMPRLGVLVFAALALGLAWRLVRYALGYPIWGDEAFVAINFMTRSYAGMLEAPLEYGQIVSAGYMWASLAVTSVLGMSEYSVRLIAFVCGIAGLFVFWLLSVRLLDRRAALFAVAIFAASYYLVRHGAEVKPYAGDVLISLGLTWLAWSISRAERPAIGRWVAFTLLAATGVWFSLPSIFVAVGLGMFLAWAAWRRKWGGRWAALVIFGAVTAASFAAMYFLYARPHAQANAWYWRIPTWKQAWPPVSQPWLIPWWLLDIHAGNMLAYPIGGKHFGSAATLILVVGGAVYLWRRGRRDIVALLLCPLIPALLAAAFKKYPYGTSARVVLYMAPAFCMLAGAGMMAMLRWLVRPRMVGEAMRMAVLVVLGIGVAGLVADVASPFKRVGLEINRHSAADICRNVRPGDQVIVGNAVVKRAHLPYLTGTNSIPWRFYMMRDCPVHIRWAPLLRNVGGAQGDTWLIHFYSQKPKDTETRDRQWNDYLARFAARFGEPMDYREYVIHEPTKPEPPSVIKVYRFAGTPTSESAEVPAEQEEDVENAVPTEGIQ